MYFWKCWRDTRVPFVISLTMLVFAAGVATCSNSLLFSRETGWSLVRADSPERAAWVWRHALRSLGAVGVAAAPLVGLVLGAIGVGDEFKPGSLDFLLTRPRPRRYFVWAGWAVGAGELLLISFAAVVFAFALLLYLTGTVHNWGIFALVPTMFAVAAVMYGLTYFLTVLLRSGRNGQALSLGVLVAYVLFCWWRIDPPGWWGLFFSSAKLQPVESFPTLQLASWSLLALAFLLAAQFVFDRADV